jgi:predicted transposase YbfD/YdcC
VFNLLDAKQFEAAFIRWMQGLCPTLAGQLIPIDGKSLRRSYSNDDPMLHLVSAWDSTRGVVLGQIKTKAKSNEITAIPALIDSLDVQGATISIDAMGCQHAIVDKIIEKKADYVIAVKENQPSLARAIAGLFDKAASEGTSPLELAIEIDKGHSRLETRRCIVAKNVEDLGGLEKTWTGLKSVALIESTREVVNGKFKGKCTTERRYYISSLELGASQCNALVRAHWGIENSCHWILDVVFREDDCRIREGHGAQGNRAMFSLDIRSIGIYTTSFPQELMSGSCSLLSVTSSLA